LFDRSLADERDEEILHRGRGFLYAIEWSAGVGKRLLELRNPACGVVDDDVNPVSDQKDAQDALDSRRRIPRLPGFLRRNRDEVPGHKLPQSVGVSQWSIRPLYSKPKRVQRSASSR
jgi:hypothetical protein